MRKVLKRQGDILLERMETPAESLVLRARVEDGVIARGEVTGHAHVLEGGELRHGDRGLLAIVSAEGAVVTHQEHDEIQLEEGVWFVHTQREYVGDGEMANVYD